MKAPAPEGLLARAQAIVALPYMRRLVPSTDGGYVATIHEFPGCVAQGESADEALDALEKSAIAWVAAALETGYPVREPVDVQDFTGKLLLTMPRTLHRRLAERAHDEGVSDEDLAVTALALYLGRPRTGA